jgi:ornithine carbamoyltransferase
MRHLLTGTELTSDDLHAILDRAAALKLAPRSSNVLEGRTVALVFQKPSTRTRVSFEAGIAEMGGHPMVLRPGETQLGRGESLRDTARVLGRHVAAVGVRTHTPSWRASRPRTSCRSSTCSPRTRTPARCSPTC